MMPPNESSSGNNKKKGRSPAIRSDPTEFDPLRCVKYPVPEKDFIVSEKMPPAKATTEDLNETSISMEESIGMFHDTVTKAFQPVTKIDIESFRGIPPSSSSREVDPLLNKSENARSSEIPSSSLCQRLVASLLVSPDDFLPLLNVRSSKSSENHRIKHGDEKFEDALMETLVEYGLFTDALNPNDAKREVNKAKCRLLDVQDNNVTIHKYLVAKTSKEIASQGPAREKKRKGDLAEVEVIKRIMNGKKKKKKTIKKIQRNASHQLWRIS